MLPLILLCHHILKSLLCNNHFWVQNLKMLFIFFFHKIKIKVGTLILILWKITENMIFEKLIVIKLLRRRYFFSVRTLFAFFKKLQVSPYLIWAFHKSIHKRGLKCSNNVSASICSPVLNKASISRKCLAHLLKDF